MKKIFFWILFPVFAFGISEDKISDSQRAYEREIKAVVRNKTYYKSGKVEVAANVSILPYDSLIMHTTAGARGIWHFSDHFAWEVIDFQKAFSSVNSFTPGLTSSLSLHDLQLPSLNWLAGTSFVVSPFYGKLKAFGTMHFDIYFNLGFGFASTETLKYSNKVGIGGPVTTSVVRTGTDPMGILGMGLKIFMGKQLTLFFEGRDYIVNTEVFSKKRLESNFSIMGGVSLFFPSFG